MRRFQVAQRGTDLHFSLTTTLIGDCELAGADLVSTLDFAENGDPFDQVKFVGDTLDHQLVEGVTVCETPCFLYGLLDVDVSLVEHLFHA